VGDCRPAGPLWGPEIRKISPERLRKTWWVYWLAARLTTALSSLKTSPLFSGTVWQVYGTLDTSVALLEVICSDINGLSPTSAYVQTLTRLDALNNTLPESFKYTSAPAGHPPLYTSRQRRRAT